MKRKDYERPTMNVFECEEDVELLAGSAQLNAKGAQIDDYEDGEFSWDD